MRFAVIQEILVAEQDENQFQQLEVEPTAELSLFELSLVGGGTGTVVFG